MGWVTPLNRDRRNKQQTQWASILCGTLLITAIAPLSAGQTQSSPDCAPPQASEYLLLAQTPTTDSQTLLRSKAPSDATLSVCRYLGKVVTRIGGFKSEPAAAAWGQYLIRTTGIPTTIAAPPSTIADPPTAIIPTATLPSSTAPSSTAPSPIRSTYNPQPLGSGYAILVNYNNRPEVATQLRQALNGKVGVVSYGERPYLLAQQTNDQAAANAIMKLLSDRGFLAMVVDARQVVLLKASIEGGN